MEAKLIFTHDEQTRARELVVWLRKHLGGSLQTDDESALWRLFKQQMRENNAVFAGELSGHYYFAENYVAESQGLSLIKLANLVCKTGKKVSELVDPLRKYFASGEINSKVADTKVILDQIRKKYSDWWFNVRASNTEPLLRLIVEAKDKATMEQKRDELLKLIRG